MKWLCYMIVLQETGVSMSEGGGGERGMKRWKGEDRQTVEK